jgi:hypothetical protein
MQRQRATHQRHSGGGVARIAPNQRQQVQSRV